MKVEGLGSRVEGLGPRAFHSRPSTLDSRLLFLTAALLLSLTACRQDMQDQPKYKNLRGSAFFTDHSSARPVVEGTVARGQLYADAVFRTGKQNGQPVATLPMTLSRELLERGRDRYRIYCTPCHGMTGDGRGIVVQRGYRQPPNFNIDRLRASPVGYFFDVQTNGFGAMMDYASQIPAADRWAIAAYVRVLQLSQSATLADVPPEERRTLDNPEAVPKAPPLPTGTDDWRKALPIEEELSNPPAAHPKEH
jgi:Cytochrome C oxidase, cbb3-type, subunit III